MSIPRTKKEAIFSYHDSISGECASICSEGAVLHEMESSLNKRILVVPPTLAKSAEGVVNRLTELSKDYCAQFERTSWRLVTPPILVREVNAATLYRNSAFSVSKLSEFERDYQLNSIGQFLHLALEQWSALEIENAQIRTTQAQIQRHQKADDLYTLRSSGFSFRVNAVTDGFTGSRTENLNQLLVLVGQSGIPDIQTRHDRKQRGAKERIPRIHFSGGSVISDSQDLTMLPATLY